VLNPAKQNNGTNGNVPGNYSPCSLISRASEILRFVVEHRGLLRKT
jgi:hypothetical protein